MKGYCDKCAKEKDCKKDIGFIWGFCNTDFVPKGKEDGNAKIQMRYLEQQQSGS